MVMEGVNNSNLHSSSRSAGSECQRPLDMYSFVVAMIKTHNHCPEYRNVLLSVVDFLHITCPFRLVKR